MSIELFYTIIIERKKERDGEWMENSQQKGIVGVEVGCNAMLL